MPSKLDISMFIAKARSSLSRTSASTRFMAACVLAIAALLTLFSLVDAAPTTVGPVLAIPALPLAVLILRRSGFDYKTITIIVAGLVLYGLYLTYTSHNDRNHDGNAQLKYIKFIATHGSFPPARHCFICHHPPLYYSLAAGAYRFCDVTGVAPPVRGAQIFSLITFFVFLIFAIKIVGRFTSRPALIHLATAFFVFWPYSVINSIRVHNDVLVSTLMTIGLYFLIRWHQEDRMRHMLGCIVLCALSVLTKSSGYILVGTLGLIWLHKLVRRPDRWPFFKRTMPVLLLLAAALLTHMLIRGQEKSVTAGLLGTAYEIKGFVGNEPHDYLYFDVENFLTKPYILARRDGTGRQLYWVHLIKSSLFATHNKVADAETAYTLNRRIAEVMVFLTFMMILFVLTGLFRFKKDHFERYTVIIVNTLLYVIFHLAFRIFIPAPHHTDFRFIYPVLIAGTLAYVMVSDQYRERGLVLHWLTYLLAIPFFALSAIYFVPKHEFVQRHLPPSVIRKPLSEFRNIVRERTKWDADRTFILPRDSVLELEVGKRKVSQLDITADHNDVYEVTLLSSTGKRRIRIGPSKKKLTGLARYREQIQPPLDDVETVRIKPRKGDHMYSIGHVRLQ